MDGLVLIDKLDDLVHNAKAVPLADQVRIDREEIYDILDQMRATIPEEIKQARWIVKERQEMLAEAKREAERIVKEARERQERLISEGEITKQAEGAAQDTIEAPRGQEEPRRSLLTIVEVIEGDITSLEVDAIANAANTELRHGGGVAAAIARTGGPEIQSESDVK